MKRIILLLCLLPLLAACQTSEALDLDRLSPEHYEQTIRAMLADTAPYEGRTLRLTGYYAESDGLRFVVRPDETGRAVGLELQWDGAAPQIGDEVTVRGTLVTYEAAGARYLALAAESLRNRSALARAEDYPVDGADYLPRLLALYEDPAAYEGTKVTISGRLRLRGDGPTVERTAAYRDGSSAPVGLAFTDPGGLPEEGVWITVTGLLTVRDGLPVLETADVLPGAGGEDIVRE